MNKLSTTFTLVLLCLTTSYLQNSVWHDDLTLWTDNLRKSPSSARGLNDLGINYIKESEYEKAIAVLQQSIDLSKDQPRSYINLVMAYEALIRMDLAIQMYDAAIYYDQSDPTAFYNLGVLYYNYYHNLDMAFEMLQKARDRNPDEPDVHLYLSYIYHDRGDDQMASAELERHLMLK